MRNKLAGAEIDENIAGFLYYGPAHNTPRDSAAWGLRCSMYFPEKEIENFWAANKDELKAQWKTEGKKGTPWVLKHLKEDVNNG